ncbi:MAG: SNF2-related protein [Anaeroplasmataceae bacterium]
MLKIDIAQIRESASSLVALNDGYGLYQNKKCQNVRIVHDSTLSYDFIIEGEFFDVGRITLYYGNNTIGNCSCHEKGLCKHEVCLFFLLKDKINDMFSNKEEMEKYESNLKVDKLLSNVYNSSIINGYNNVEIYPTVTFEGGIGLFLDAIIDGRKMKVKDIKKFLYAIRTKSDYTFNFKTIKLGVNVLSDKSNRLINLIKYLDSSINTIKLDLSLFDDIYALYSDMIYVYNGYYSKPYYFTNDDFILKLLVNNNKLTISDTDYKLIESVNNYYIFYKEKIYVNNNHTLHLVLEYLKENNGEIIFNKDNYNSFLINIYPYIKEYVNGVEYCFDLSIESYIDYKDKKLSIKYKTDIEDDYMFINRTNYLALIEKYGFSRENGYIIDNYDTICDFLTKGIIELEKYGFVYLSDNAKGIKIRNMKKLNFNLSLDGGIVNFIYDNTTYNLEEINKMILAYKNKEKYVLLNDETVCLDYSELEDITSLMDDLGIDAITDVKLKLYQAYYINSKYKKYFTISNNLASFINDMVMYNDYNVSLDNSISSVLRDYQLVGYKWLRVLSDYGFGGILADDMGLGKTLQIIALVSSLHSNKPILIVSPTSLIFNWAMEFKKFAPNINYEVMYGEKRNIDNIKRAIKNNAVIIVSYEILRIDIDNYKDIDFKLCVIDEAQYIKNPDALKTIAVKSIKSDIRIALTGTPIENSLIDLWSIFDFVLPGYLESRNKFISKYENFNSNTDVLLNLNKRVSPFMLRRLKTDVLDLEEKIETYSISTMSKEERRLYDSYLLDAKESLKKDNYKISSMLSVLTRLRQIACEPRLFLDNVNINNSKMDMLMEIVEEKIADNHKILLFSQFTSIFPYIERRFDDLNIKYLKLTGQTASVDRAYLVEEFNSNPDIKVFLISLKAGGTGLNLTSADTVIHYDPWWNTAAMNQATDRCYRIGQEKCVHVIKMINKGTIEEKIVELQEKKKYLFDSVISEDEAIKKISAEDLKELFL